MKFKILENENENKNSIKITEKSLNETLGLTDSLQNATTEEDLYFGKYIYLFPSTLTKMDLEEMNHYNLEILGYNEFKDEKNIAVKGYLKDLYNYCKNYLDYAIHPDYLYKEDEFAGEIEPYNNDVPYDDNFNDTNLWGI